MARPLWFVKLIKKTFPNVSIIAKLTNLPIIGTFFDHLLFKGDDIIYLPQDKVIKVNKPLGEYDEYVLPSQVLEYFIEKAKHHWIMNFCICRSSMKCKDYPIDLGCLFIGDAVLDINPQLGRLVSKKEALEHLEKCRDAGLVHMAYIFEGKDKVERVCSCCSCCCHSLSAALRFGYSDHVFKSKFIATHDQAHCNDCGLCEERCQFKARELINDKLVFHKEKCFGCGLCVKVCEENAISMIERK